MLISIFQNNPQILTIIKYSIIHSLLTGFSSHNSQKDSLFRSSTEKDIHAKNNQPITVKIQSPPF